MGVPFVLMSMIVVTAQNATPAPAVLAVGGDVRTQLSLTAADLKTMTRTRLQMKGESGSSVSYEGVLVAEILRRAGAPLGEELRGNAMATYVLATAADGYQVVYSLAELDPAFTNSQIIVADTVEGEPLLADEGPMQIVAPLDARAARWVRMLQRLDVVRLRD